MLSTRKFGVVHEQFKSLGVNADKGGGREGGGRVEESRQSRPNAGDRETDRSENRSLSEPRRTRQRNERAQEHKTKRAHPQSSTGAPSDVPSAASTCREKGDEAADTAREGTATVGRASSSSRVADRTAARRSPCSLPRRSRSPPPREGAGTRRPISSRRKLGEETRSDGEWCPQKHR